MRDEDGQLGRTELDVRAAKEGSARAMEELFQRYLPQVRSIVAARMGRRLQDVLDLEDMVQESMRLAIEGLENFEYRSEGSFRSWLAMCVENAIRNESRKQGTKKRGAGQVQRVADLPQTRLSETLFPAEPAGVSRAVREREEEDRLEAALLQLAPRYREVIALRAFGEMSYRDIAATMNLPSENTANALFVRARRKLLRLLDGEGT